MRTTKEQQYGAAATAIVHLLLFLLLWFLVINKPLPQEEEGVPVIMGDTEPVSYTHLTLPTNVNV